jgi:hypothetical protein
LWDVQLFGEILASKQAEQILSRGLPGKRSSIKLAENTGLSPWTQNSKKRHSCAQQSVYVLTSDY